MRHIRMILPTICLFVSAAGFATDEDIYKWVDAKQQVHYGSNPPVGVNATLITPNGAPSEGDVQKAKEINQSLVESTASIAAPACDQAKKEYEQIATAPAPENEEAADADKRKAMIEEKRAAADKACAP